MEARKGIRLPGAKVRGCGCFELNSGPLEEQRALLKPESLLHLPESLINSQNPQKREL